MEVLRLITMGGHLYVLPTDRHDLRFARSFFPSKSIDGLEGEIPCKTNTRKPAIIKATHLGEAVHLENSLGKNLP